MFTTRLIIVQFIFIMFRCTSSMKWLASRSASSQREYAVFNSNILVNSVGLKSTSTSSTQFSGMRDARFDAVGGSTRFRLGNTGNRVDLNWQGPNSFLTITKEAENRLAAALLKRGEYVDGLNLSESRISEIEKICNQEGVLFEQAMSLRKQLLVTKIMRSGGRLRREEAFIRSSYAQGISLAKLSRRKDLPAVALLRAVLTKRVRKFFPSLSEKEIKTVVKWALRLENRATLSGLYGKNTANSKNTGLNNSNIPGTEGATTPTSNLVNGPVGVVLQALESSLFWAKVMTSREIDELQIAKTIDQSSFQEEFVQERDVSAAWEESLYAYLDAQGVAYYNELDLKDMQVPVTPDAVIVDDCYINGVGPIRWVDCKCFYGSTRSSAFQDKLRKQVRRYNEEFDGIGAIVYKLGYCDDLVSFYEGDVLILEAGPLNAPEYDNTSTSSSI
mmetsp:Transcript_32786/g.55277  ORF Transcript_32786/g.55277 Transcript_32786/m.55277 type:complete len:446 (-) Transcript_32786:205-1542(-)